MVNVCSYDTLVVENPRVENTEAPFKAKITERTFDDVEQVHP